jgi:hypothetical protein
VPIALLGAADSQFADDLHEVVHFSVLGRFADFQVLFHADAGKEGQDHLREYRRFCLQPVRAPHLRIDSRTDFALTGVKAWRIENTINSR